MNFVYRQLYFLGLWTVPLHGEVKRQELARMGSEAHTWIETGTYMGETTKFLAKRFPRVITIEPQPDLYSMATESLSNFKNVVLLKGSSEEQFEAALGIAGNFPLAFWLDGHYSAGKTFKGLEDTPIVFELQQIEAHMRELDVKVICIDDERLFGTDPGYPSKDFLVSYCKRNRFSWSVTSDIFEMRRL